MLEFRFCKEKNKRDEDDDEISDCYTWVALDRPTEFAFVSGRRTLENAMELTTKNPRCHYLGSHSDNQRWPDGLYLRC
jgi:hypothetical protein